MKEPFKSELFGTTEPVALVTGSAAPRVGRTIAQYLAERGCAIAVHGNHSAAAGNEFVEALQQAGTKAAFFSADLQESAAPSDLVANVHDHFGRIDITVNSAAIWYPTPLEDVSQQEIEKYNQVNNIASFMIAKESGLRMSSQQNGGVIINLGDWATLRPYTDYSAYFLSKGNLPVMTRMLAVELAERNPRIRVNAVLPGPVMIPKDLSPELREQIIHATLLKREGSPDNVAAACVSLIENDFITGACLPVDGGRSVYSPYNPV